MAGRLQPRRAIDEKKLVIDEMFLAEFREEHLGKSLCSRRIETNMEQAIGRWINRFVQPIAFGVELDHRFTNRNVIRVSSLNWL
ncbi:hypothetical protein GCM10009037_26510 [Halarchaeum grantii]|uniref:Uncharacterized protein n=1 Tax=Halarchaeum grantii TaxID=1193105 RepID=A0A830FCR2_9EURY|nr:hypothetical protein GCM10009037_26510 [Halarchaeum grantii]